jgi:hypothetical protein
MNPSSNAVRHGASWTHDKIYCGKETAYNGQDWRTRISAQERSGISVKQFCKQQGVTEQSFYYWRSFGASADDGRTAPDERRGGCCNIAASAGGACAHDSFAGQRAGVLVLDGLRYAQEL